MLREIDSRVGGCHYCTSGLYAPLPAGQECLCSKTAHNGAATVVDHRSQYPDRSEVDRSPVEIREFGEFGRIVNIR